jgi:hypothetical protein
MTNEYQYAAENVALRAELERQWRANHEEHCGEPCSGAPCMWPRPALLEPAADRERGDA